LSRLENVMTASGTQTAPGVFFLTDMDCVLWAVGSKF